MRISTSKLSCLLTLSLLSSISFADTVEINKPVTQNSIIDYADNGKCFNLDPIKGRLYKNTEVEPFIAANPNNPNNIIIAFQQSRFGQLGGAGSVDAIYTVDGGTTWLPVAPGKIPFSVCAVDVNAQSILGSYQPYHRATDPWVLFDNDGTAYYMTLPYDQDVNTSEWLGAMVVTKSPSVDNIAGQNWGNIITIAKQSGKGNGVPAPDKNTMTYDPTTGNIYGVWTQYQWGSHGSSYIAISKDKGLTWSSDTLLYNPNNDTNMPKLSPAYVESQNNQIVVLKDGTLVNLILITAGSDKSIVGVVRSLDHGKSWDKRLTKIAEFPPTELSDTAKDSQGNTIIIPVRSATNNAFMAVDPNNDNLYITWSAIMSGSNKVGVYVVTSTDKGKHWSSPQQLNLDVTVDAFLPMIAVAKNSVIGVFYYDFRKDNSSPSSNIFATNAYIASFNYNAQTDKLVRRCEKSLTQKPFDMRQAPVMGGPSNAGGVIIPGGYFLGDYFGMTSLNSNGQNYFVLAYTITNNVVSNPPEVPLPDETNTIDTHNHNDIVFAKVKIDDRCN